MDRYSARMNLYGYTERERAKNKLKKDLLNKIPGSLSYKTVKINGKDSELVIDSGTQPYYKKFTTLPNQNVDIGDYVEWVNSHWLITTCDYDDEIYKNGSLVQCNYLLKWQNELGDIVERWAFIQSASKYNDGTELNNIISLGSDQLSIVVALDSETIKLKKSMCKKFFIDNNKSNPTAYELTGTGNVPDTYNGHGVTSWIVKECSYTATSDDLKYGVCEYMSNTKDDLIEDTNELIINATISGSEKINRGFSNEYFVVFTDEFENDIDDILFDWNVVSDFDIDTSINGKFIDILINDKKHVGKTFLLQIVQNGKLLAEKKITIKDKF